jgi:mannose-6-phosphate isomerase
MPDSIYADFDPNRVDGPNRPWGRYEVLQDMPTHKVKAIWVDPGKRLSYQRHQHRSEHWYVVYGTAEVVIDGHSSVINSGDTVTVTANQLHRIGNVGKVPMLFIEVQTGTYFGEDDIERIEDDYGRGE